MESGHTTTVNGENGGSGVEANGGRLIGTIGDSSNGTGIASICDLRSRPGSTSIGDSSSDTGKEASGG